MPDAADIPRFTFAAYARDRWAALLVGAFCLAGMVCMLSVLGIGAHACLLVTGFVATCLVALFVSDFARRARYYRDAAEFVAQIGQVGQFTSLVGEPEFLEGRILYHVTDQLANVANGENAAEREQAQAHREYIELWIHEIKTPIAAAKLMLASMHGQQATKLKGELERIETQVDQALYSARSTSVSNDYAIRELNLASAVRAACRKNTHFLIERGVELRVQVPEETSVLADEPWLTFMLGQVITNAAKYGAHAITFSAREEEPGTPRERTVLEVRDDGCGIPAADVPRVFDRGFTGSVGRAQGSATGMGLYLVAVMCARMGLGVGLASEEGVGTRVLFAFPHDRRRALSTNPPPVAF
ncbi:MULTISPECIES: HAMP domain-containing sensor histidine kinase [unclassified Adlercreutzia]|uniref:sensor histidine kinase n=1 Tax=unclassified Adlercreutzia TaxID=2636013 RepID=UPI0013ECAB11|nr:MULTISPECIES: sensor histidine kinase [unclassified Adlercreutzia]